jgi:hypothetical protein
LSVTCNRSAVFSGYSVSSTNKTDRHDVTEILLIVALNTTNLAYKHFTLTRPIHVPMDIRIMAVDMYNNVMMVNWFSIQIYYQQYLSYIVAVSFIGWGNGIPGENHRPVASHWQALSHNVASSTLRHERDLNSQL